MTSNQCTKTGLAAPQNFKCLPVSVAALTLAKHRGASQHYNAAESFLMPAKIDKGKFYYREHMFAVGDKVSVWSTLTKKRFSGVIAALAPTEVVLRLPDHSLARIALTHIRHGRCVFSPIEAAP